MNGVFCDKQNCLDTLPPGHIVGNWKYFNYFHRPSHEKYMKTIKSKSNPSFFEFINSHHPVKLFFDVEIFLDKNPDLYENDTQVIKDIAAIYGNNYILLKSHKVDVKKSYHIIYPEVYFENVAALKREILSRSEFERYVKDKIIDVKVYREGLLRTIYSSKPDETRPLIYSADSPIKNKDIDTFIQYCPNPAFQVRTAAKPAQRPEKALVKKGQKIKSMLNDLDIASISKIIDSVNPTRFTDRNKWLNVGYILKGISTSLNGEWHRFSAKWDSYNQQNAEQTWRSLKATQAYTIADLNNLLAKDIKEVIGEITKEIYRVVNVSKHCIELFPKSHNNCLVNASLIHEKQISHIEANVKTRKVVCTCSECGEFRPPASYQSIMLQQIKLIIIQETKEEGALNKVSNLLLMDATEKSLKKDRNGMVCKPVHGLSYAYTPYKKIFEWAQDILIDNEDARSHQNVLDNVSKLLSQMRFTEFDFIERGMDYIGFKNGIYNLVTCEFIDVPPNDLVVRKYFDLEFYGSSDTPLTEKILNDQFEEYPGVCEFIFMMIGRLFHRVQAHDNWECMLYLMGLPGTGKSTLMNIVMEMVSDQNIGSISVGFERTFGLSSLYQKDIIVIDDLPKNIDDVFPQTTFQSCVSGNIVNIAIKNSSSISEKWSVPMIWGGNWYPSYLDCGQVTRRVICAEFGKKIRNGDPTVFKKITELEMAALIHKTSLLYKQYREKYDGVSIWNFCPEYFKEQQKNMKLDRNPLLRFLLENEKMQYQKGQISFLSDIKDMFSDYIGKNVRTLDHGTFLEANDEWTIKKVTVCVFCLKNHVRGCCDKYSHSKKTMKPVVENLCIRV